MGITALSALFYAAGAMYGANQRAENALAKAQAESDSDAAELAANNAIRYFGYMPNGQRMDGVLSTSAAMPKLYEQGWKVDGIQIGTNQRQELKTPFESQPVYYDNRSNTIGTAQRVTSIRNQMPFAQQSTAPAEQQDDNLGLRFLQTGQNKPSPNTFQVSNLPIVGWTNEDGSYAIDSNYKEIQNLISEPETVFTYIGPNNESQTATGPAGFARLRKLQIEKGGELRKGPDQTLVDLPEQKDKEGGIDEIRILQNGRFVPFGSVPVKTQRAAMEGGVQVATFRDGKMVSEKPYFIDQQQEGKKTDIVEEMVMLAPNNIVNVTELTSAQFEKYKLGEYPRALYKNGVLEGKFDKPEFAKDADTGDERVLIPSVEMPNGEYGSAVIKVTDLNPAQMEKYMGGQYKTAMFKNDQQQGEFKFPDEKTDSGSGSGGKTDDIATDPKFLTVKGDDANAISFSIPIDDYTARGAARFGALAIIRHPNEFMELMEAKPNETNAWLETLAENIVQTFVDRSKAGRPENAPIVIPENFVDTWAAQNYEIINMFPELGLREKVQNAVGQVIVDSRTLANPDGNNLVVEDIVEVPDGQGGTQDVRVIAGVEIPRNSDGTPRFDAVIQGLSNRGFKPGDIASMVRFQKDELGLPIMQDGAKVPLPVEQQDVLLAVDQLFKIPLEFTVKRDLPAQNLKKGQTYTGTYYDAMKRMVTPDAYAMVESTSIDNETQEAIANVFMAMSGDDPRVGMDFIKKIYPVAGTTVEKVLEDKFGPNFDKVKQAKAARANAAQDAELSALNMESTFYTIGPNNEKVLMNVNTAVGRWVLGVDGGLYLLDTARQVLSGSFMANLAGRGEATREIGQDSASIMGAARTQFATTMQFVTAPDQLENTERFQNMTAGERAAAIEASREARSRNGALFNRIIRDMSAPADEMVTVYDETARRNIEVSKRLLATRQYYKFILAYQIAAAIQGGTGGRTISDQDVENILSAFNFDTYSTPEAELATIREARRMMTRIKIVDGAYASSNVSDVYAAMQYERMEGLAGDAFRPTVYDIVTEAASKLQQAGARDRGATGISTDLGSIQPGSAQEASILDSFSLYHPDGIPFTTLEEAKKDENWPAFERAMKPI